MVSNPNTSGGKFAVDLRDKLAKISAIIARKDKKTSMPGNGKQSLQSADDVSSWADNFDSLLRSKYGRTAFRAFLAMEFAEENLDLWIAVEDFRVSSPKSRNKKSMQIFTQFFAPFAPQEVNVNAATRADVEAQVASPSVEMFDAAQKRVYLLMEQEVYPRFLQGDLYRGLRSRHSVSMPDIRQ